MFWKKKNKTPELTSSDVKEVLQDEASSILKSFCKGLGKVLKWLWQQWLKLPAKFRKVAYGLLVAWLVIFTAVMFIDRREGDNVAPTWRWWLACAYEQHETGRMTKYSIFNNVCYIESLTSTPDNVIWIRSTNDRGFGDGEGE